MLNLIAKIWNSMFKSGKSPEMISFLLGSGFSVAAGLPLVSAINRRMRKIDEHEIRIHTDGTAIFLNGQENKNAWSRQEERWFVQEFLEFYCSEIIETEESFHYEDFFDFYSKYLREGYESDDDPINKFCDSFRDKHINDFQVADNLNMVSSFHDAFSQLLGNLLQKREYYDDAMLTTPPAYDHFLSFLKEAIEKNQIRVHTLNHDLLFEKLGKALWQDFTDGFSDIGSPYYSFVTVEKCEHKPVSKKYRVRLKYFQNKFDEKICLFKLHGSVDTYQFDISNRLQDLARVKLDYGVDPHHIVKEILDKNTGELKYERGIQNAFPDFLSGTTEKMRSYGNEYYRILFDHFSRNLQNSKLLIVIGYGFADKGINDLLERHYLKRGGKMVVINPSKPDSNLLEYKNVKYIPKKLEQVTLEEFNSLID